MNPGGGKALGAGSLVSIAGYASAAPADRLYLVHRGSSSQRLEVVGSRINVSVVEGNAPCVAFHHNCLRRGSVTAVALAAEDEPVIRFWVDK